MTGDAAFIAAAIFAVHPIQAEVVDYVWARSIALAAVFCFAAWLEWIRGRRWTAVLWFAAALLAKEECAAFPLALLLLDPVGRRKRLPQESGPSPPCWRFQCWPGRVLSTLPL